MADLPNIPIGGFNKEKGGGALNISAGTGGGYHASSDASLFSCSVPVLSHEKPTNQYSLFR